MALVGCVRSAHTESGDHAQASNRTDLLRRIDTDSAALQAALETQLTSDKVPTLVPRSHVFPGAPALFFLFAAVSSRWIQDVVPSPSQS
jgi:hypothetical protein